MEGVVHVRQLRAARIGPADKPPPRIELKNRLVLGHDREFDHQRCVALRAYRLPPHSRVGRLQYRPHRRPSVVRHRADPNTVLRQPSNEVGVHAQFVHVVPDFERVAYGADRKIDAQDVEPKMDDVQLIGRKV